MFHQETAKPAGKERDHRGRIAQDPDPRPLRPAPYDRNSPRICSMWKRIRRARRISATPAAVGWTPSTCPLQQLSTPGGLHSRDPLARRGKSQVHGLSAVGKASALYHIQEKSKIS
jgi:hypothetical protein